MRPPLYLAGSNDPASVRSLASAHVLGHDTENALIAAFEGEAPALSAAQFAELRKARDRVGRCLTDAEARAAISVVCAEDGDDRDH